MIPRYRDMRYTHLLVIDGLLIDPPKKKYEFAGREDNVGLILNAPPDVLDFVLKRYCPVPYECCQRRACGYLGLAAPAHLISRGKRTGPKISLVNCDYRDQWFIHCRRLVHGGDEDSNSAPSGEGVRPCWLDCLIMWKAEALSQCSTLQQKCIGKVVNKGLSITHTDELWSTKYI